MEDELALRAHYLFDFISEGWYVQHSLRAAELGHGILRPCLPVCVATPVNNINLAV